MVRIGNGYIYNHKRTFFIKMGPIWKFGMIKQDLLPETNSQIAIFSNFLISIFAQSHITNEGFN